jgi:hypothetical protein
MNKIIKEHYPAAKLPEDLREGLAPQQMVTVTVLVEEAMPEKVLTLDEIFALRQPPYKSIESINSELRQQRDEWDE